MAGWSMLELGDAMLAGEALDGVRHAFEAEFPAGGASAVLMRHESAGRLHCAVQLYFPPDLSALALRCGAGPCAAPRHRDLGVLVGDPACRARLMDAPETSP